MVLLLKIFSEISLMFKYYFLITLLIPFALHSMDLPEPKEITRVLCTCICGTSSEQVANRNARNLWRGLDDGLNASQFEQMMAAMHDEPVNAQYKLSDSSITLLNWTITRGNVSLLSFLLDKSASIKTDDGCVPLLTALQHSMPKKRHQMITLLLTRSNANPLKKNRSGVSALQYAHTIKDITAVKLLDESVTNRINKARYLMTRVLGDSHPFPTEIAFLIAQKAFALPEEINENFK